MKKHPHCKTPEPPERDGRYLIQSCPGDCWRPIRFSHYEFRSGLMIETVYAWKPIGEEE